MMAILAAALLAAQEPSPPLVPEIQIANPDQPQPAQEPPRDILIGTEATPAVVTVTRSQEETEQEDADRRRETTTQRWTAGLTSAIAIFTLALVYVGWKQRQTYEATLAANKAIERAYIFVSQVEVFDNYAIGERPRVLLTVVNSGHTPGWLLNAGTATIPVTDVSKHLPRPMPVDWIGMRGQKQVIFAQQRTTWGNALGPVAEADYVSVQNGTWKLVVFGRIEYRDVFERVHHSDFSFVWKFKEGKSGPEDFNIHPDGYTDAT